MDIGEVLTAASVVIFVLGMVTFAVVYRRLLQQTIEEYTRVKIVVRGLIATLHKLKDGTGESTVQRILGVKAAQAKTTQETVKLQELEGTLVNLTKWIQTISASDRKIRTHMMNVQRELQNLKKIQEALQKRINTLNDKIQQTPRLERSESMLRMKEQPRSRITETERRVLDLLVNVGSMTAPEVEKKINKTREHTARLMKKLWKDGYVERDSHRKPFTYRSIKKLQKKTGGKKTKKIVSTITKKAS